MDALICNNGVDGAGNMVSDANLVNKAILDPESSLGVPIYWNYIRILWLIDNYGLTNGNNDACQFAKKTLSDISQNSHYSFVRRWASEAMSDKNNISVMPKRIWTGKKIRTKPEGIFMDMNGDKKTLIPYNPKDFDF